MSAIEARICRLENGRLETRIFFLMYTFTFHRFFTVTPTTTYLHIRLTATYVINRTHIIQLQILILQNVCVFLREELPIFHYRPR